MTREEIVCLGAAAHATVGGKNANMAALNSIPGVRGAPFRAVTASAYNRHLDENRIVATAMDDHLDRLFEKTDFRALAERHGSDFLKDFVLEQGMLVRAGAFSSGARSGARPSFERDVLTLREYVERLIDRAKDALREPELSASARHEILRRLSVSAQIAILGVELPSDLRRDIARAYRDIAREAGKPKLEVAVRSSAVGEDGDEAAFAGAQDTYLNISGAGDVILHVQRNFASGFNLRALEYRLSQIEKEVEERKTPLDEALEKFDFQNIAVSVTIQKMIKARKAGTAFSVDPASGMSAIAIDANFGYGESVVGGRVTPDSYFVTQNGRLIVKTPGEKRLMVVDKKGGGTEEVPVPRESVYAWTLDDGEVREIARQVKAVAAHYKKFVDTEFAIDETGVYLVQARPETKHNEHELRAPGIIHMRREEVPESALEAAPVLVRGDGASKGAACARAHFVENVHDPRVFATFKKGDILVAERTDPDFLPLFKLAGAVVANVGGRTSHAAITSRELGLPAVIGVGDLDLLRSLDGAEVTVDGSRGAVYRGNVRTESAGEDIDTRELSKLNTETSVGLILADLDQAKALHALSGIPDFKVGLLRAEFVLGAIGVHYKALKAFDHGLFDEAVMIFDRGSEEVERRIRDIASRMSDPKTAPLVTERDALLSEMINAFKGADPARAIDDLESTKAKLSLRIEKSGFGSGHEFFVESLSQRIALFAYAFEGKDVIYRTTDYKSNEYEGLVGGSIFEESEPNPMLGYRGVARSIDPWETEAFVRARNIYGAENLHIMFPFVRTEEEIMSTIAATRAQGLRSGDKGLKVFVMAEIPSVAALPNSFLKYVDGFSIGSNDLTQGMLMTDRDSARLQRTYDEEDPAVVQGILSIIFAAVRNRKEAGFCGQGVSNSEFLASLVSVAGIASASVTPDVYAKVKRLIHGIEAKRISVDDLGDWMNAYKAREMASALDRASRAGGLSGRAEAPPPHATPREAHAWLSNALDAAHARSKSADREIAESAMRDLCVLRKLVKPVLHARTNWNEVVSNALHTAGFRSAKEYDRALGAYRRQMRH